MPSGIKHSSIWIDPWIDWCGMNSSRSLSIGTWIVGTITKQWGIWMKIHSSSSRFAGHDRVISLGRWRSVGWWVEVHSVGCLFERCRNREWRAVGTWFRCRLFCCPVRPTFVVSVPNNWFLGSYSFHQFWRWLSAPCLFLSCDTLAPDMPIIPDIDLHPNLNMSELFRLEI